MGHQYFIFICCCNSCKCLHLKTNKNISSENIMKQENNIQHRMHKRSVSMQNILNKTTANKIIQQDDDSYSNEEDDVNTNLSKSNRITLSLVNDTSKDLEVEYIDNELDNGTKKRRVKSLLESIVFFGEFESIRYNEDNNMIESKWTSLQSKDSDSSIHHVRFNSNRNHIMSQMVDINAMPKFENQIIS